MTRGQVNSKLTYAAAVHSCIIENASSIVQSRSQIIVSGATDRMTYFIKAFRPTPHFQADKKFEQPMDHQPQTQEKDSVSLSSSIPLSSVLQVAESNQNLLSVSSITKELKCSSNLLSFLLYCTGSRNKESGWVVDVLMG